MPPSPSTAPVCAAPPKPPSPPSAWSRGPPTTTPEPLEGFDPDTRRWLITMTCPACHRATITSAPADYIWEGRCAGCGHWETFAVAPTALHHPHRRAHRPTRPYPTTPTASAASLRCTATSTATTPSTNAHRRTWPFRPPLAANSTSTPEGPATPAGRSPRPRACTRNSPLLDHQARRPPTLSTTRAN